MTLAHLIAKEIVSKKPLQDENDSITYTCDGDVEYNHTLYAFTSECRHEMRGEDIGDGREEPFEFYIKSESLEVFELRVSDEEGWVAIVLEDVQKEIDVLLS